jgi:hypothetical protein
MILERKHKLGQPRPQGRGEGNYSEEEMNGFSQFWLN